jgi:membrane protease YdiL (CAAX protease family)
MSVLHLVAVALLIVSIVFAVIHREQSPIYYAVLSAVVLYVLNGVL